MYLSKINALEWKQKKLGSPRPFFLKIFIDGLPKNLNSQLLVYADDTLLIANHHSFDRFTQITQLANNKSAYEWFYSNKLSKKTQFITSSLKPEINLESFKILGIKHRLKVVLVNL